MKSLIASTIVVGLGAAALAGCAGTPERPVEDIAKAQTLISQAAQSGAQQYAAADLNRAREKLQQAEEESSKRGGEHAGGLAREAIADAELAVAKARQAKAEEAADELARSVETLRQESNRGQTGER